MWEIPNIWEQQNLIHEEIKSRLNLGNMWYRSVQYHLSSHLLHKNVEIQTYKTIVFPVVLYRCETWSLTKGIKMFENKMLKRISGQKRDDIIEGLKNCIIATCIKIA
jgi:hypothetical protein